MEIPLALLLSFSYLHKKSMAMAIWHPFFFVFVLLVGFSLGWCAKERRRKGPFSWPLLGALPSLLRHSHDIHDYLAWQSAKHGTFTLPLPGIAYVYTVHPKNVEYMLKTRFTNFVKGDFMHDKGEEFFGDGIFNVDGEKWIHQRKVASFEFASKALRDYSEDAFRNCASKAACILASYADAMQPAEIQDLMLRMTMDSICKVGFGVDMDCLAGKSAHLSLQAFAQAFENCSAHVFWRYFDPLWKLKRWAGLGDEPRFAKDVTIIDNFIYRMMAAREEEILQTQKMGGKVKGDFLSRFMALQESLPCEKYSKKQIRDMVVNFLVAGRDTVATTLSWFFYMISCNPSVQEKLMEEILGIDLDRESLDMRKETPFEERVKKFAHLLTFERLNQMNYLQACLTETLRLYPAVPVDCKIALEADTLPDGTELRAGDCLSYVPYAMGRMEWLWGSDCLQFKPERFLEDGMYCQESPYKLTAFQAGPRICLGKSFAYLQMKVTAAILLRFFMFELVPGHEVHYKVMLNLRLASNGLLVNVLPRLV